jgi:acyl dehydratase
VHAEHDLTLHRAVRQGDRLTTAVRITSVQSRKPGAFVVFRFDTQDVAGKLVSTTDFGVLYRGTGGEGADRGKPIELLSSQAEMRELGTIRIEANAAHVYTECARIFNPIHTDIAHARAAGLPGIILHGTATLALSISKALRAFDADPLAVKRVRCRFSGMVLMPNTLHVYGVASGARVFFETRNAAGESVVSRAAIDIDG